MKLNKEEIARNFIESLKHIRFDEYGECECDSCPMNSQIYRDDFANEEAKLKDFLDSIDASSCLQYFLTVVYGCFPIEIFNKIKRYIEKKEESSYNETDTPYYLKILERAIGRNEYEIE